MDELKDILKHHGIKGMRWGVRRSRSSSGKSSAVKEPKRSKIGQHLDSWKREREWHQVLKQVNNMSTKDINIATKRIRLENDLKTLSKSKVSTSKDKSDYLRRGKMSDQELSRKVTRLRAKDGLHRAVKDASKEQREFGEKVVQVGSSLGVKYAMNKSIKPKDIFTAVADPKKASGEAKRTLTEDILDRSKLSDNGKKTVKDFLDSTKKSKS